MKKYLPLLLFIAGCSRDFEAPVPSTVWELYDDPSARALNGFTRTKMEGVYQFTAGQDAFGNETAAHWSYTVSADTVFHLSFFCEKEVAYFIMEGKRRDGAILLNGYWRRMTNTQTGRARFTISPANGAGHLLIDAPQPAGDSIIIEGLYGFGEEIPALPLRMKYIRPLFQAQGLEILAHRGGGSTSDLLPASENSIEMIRLASRFGATGVEIDVRLTSDGVPILFHDITLNERVIQKNGLLGPISNYSYAQLDALVRLTNGEKIPTLRQALQTILYQTPLRFVWLDTKFSGSMEFLRDIQQEFTQLAASSGRNLEIQIGIPDEDVLNQFRQLPGFTGIPSICELDPEIATSINAKVWAPRWTLGLQNELVTSMQAQGRRVFVWTMDIPANIRQYIYEGRFNGILSNYPSAVAFYYYAKQ